MIEQFYKDPAFAQRQRACLLGSHFDRFAEFVSDLGYSQRMVQFQLGLVAAFARWLQRNGFGVANLDEQRINDFLNERCRVVRPDGRARSTLVRFLEHLRAEGTVPSTDPKVDDSPLARLESRYERYLRRERGLAEVTIGSYRSLVRRFLVERFDAQQIEVRELAPKDIVNFFVQYAPSWSLTVAKHTVTALRSFLSFLFQYGETDANLAATVPTIPTRQLAEVPKYLSADEVERLLDACDRSRLIGRRDYAILLLLARLGLRAGEVVAMELDDIDWRAGEVTVRGKGYSQDRLPLPQDVGRALATYLRRDRPKCSTRRLFIRARAPYRGFGDGTTVSTIAAEAFKRAGLTPPVKGAHILRHSLATNMLRRGASMAEIAEILRHRMHKTTEIYAKVDLEGLRPLARAWPGAGGAR
jgi:site-specific recombinase XerD